ncbi:MAG: hypothetical protein H7Z21_11080 [Hymenobacter sp.]|nr:hypothetical protein [Hymenobacter sp.]
MLSSSTCLLPALYAHPANPSASHEAAVRAHFGLSQQQLARYLGVIIKRESDVDYQRDKAPDDAAGISARLTRLTSQITGLTTSLATLTPGPDEHRRTDEELTDAEYEQKKPGFRQQSRGPVYLVLREADADEALTRRTSLEASRTAVVARRARLWPLFVT